MLSNNQKKLEYTDLGVMHYKAAWDLQTRLREDRINGKIGDRILLVEHPPVFTMGRKDCEDDFVVDKKMIEQLNIDIIKTNRGGRTTYHGPGQLVCYFIVSLESIGLGIKEFVRAIEDIVLNFFDGFEVKGARDPEHPGIWIGTSKIAAIGLNVTHNVTEHGVAINANCNLTPYNYITACGIRDRGVTSLKKLLGHEIDMEAAKKTLLECCAKRLGCDLENKKI